MYSKNKQCNASFRKSLKLFQFAWLLRSIRTTIAIVFQQQIAIQAYMTEFSIKTFSEIKISWTTIPNGGILLAGQLSIMLKVIVIEYEISTRNTQHPSIHTRKRTRTTLSTLWFEKTKRSEREKVFCYKVFCVVESFILNNIILLSEHRMVSISKVLNGFPIMCCALILAVVHHNFSKGQPISSFNYSSMLKCSHISY